MSANVLPFREAKKKPTVHDSIAWSSEAFARRVDYNLSNIRSHWFMYIHDIGKGVLMSQIAGSGSYVEDAFILRVDREIKRCSVFECRAIIHQMDKNLARPTISESPDKFFFIHIRNRAFLLLEYLRKTKRVHLSDSLA